MPKVKNIRAIGSAYRKNTLLNVNVSQLKKTENSVNRRLRRLNSLTFWPIMLKYVKIVNVQNYFSTLFFAIPYFCKVRKRKIPLIHLINI